MMRSKDYDFVWDHKPGEHNQVVDALSRKEGGGSWYQNGGWQHKDLMKEAHGTTWAGHSGVERM
ncbi:hypothetical protein KY290_035085 [Solanum tuberosum]|uniref:RNase H family protein n=1 Tax=Solanum tuberosum TaxID=4113 RepID=A0ABQ7U519_SOLTU|nr:hypothetical protein KY289_034581 [Solanum tuberosum]KAH0646428.1 hypothetical protein KY284_034312 [Solanum tuberosum]KAH0649105.1 hypothetical protein KY285_034353 [Solanum tuberosum]KAH0742042.1 hypothetical protein KY290_035085 [Solanum tuberosum]